MRMHFNVVCGGASLRSACGRSGALLRVLLLIACLARPSVAVCVHCKGFFAGCTGGDACPLVKELKSNVATVAAASPTAVPSLASSLPADMLTVFTRPICEACMAIAHAPAAGKKVDLAGGGYALSSDVVRASFMGHCTYEDASLELARRLEEAVDQLTADKVKGAIELLKNGARDVHANLHSATAGVYTFIWAKVGQYFEMLKKGTVKLAMASSKSSSTDMSATVRYPESGDEFRAMIDTWVLVVSCMGLIAFPLAMRFVHEVVNYAQLQLKKSYKFACCLFMVYLKKVETDSTRTLSLATVVSAGMHDACIKEAEQHEAAFFRTRGGNLRDDDDVDDDKVKKWNGKFDANSKTACSAFNFGKPHTPAMLNADGSCKRNHRCNQWVDDKGPAGMCWAKHARCNGCDYDEAHKCTKPVA